MRDGRKGFGRRMRLAAEALFAFALPAIVCFGGCGGIQAYRLEADGGKTYADSGTSQKGGEMRQEAGGLRQTEDGCMEPTGSLQLAGSSSMEKLTDALAECFMERYPGITVTVQFTGSSAGIESVLRGSADIAITSRELSEEEKAGGLTGYAVALDGIAVCVDSGNPVTEITWQQLRDIYTGKITNWSSIGGGDMPVVLIGREAGSGTREAFEELLGIRGRCTYANELDSTGAVMARVASTPGAVGYLSFDVLHPAAEPAEWKEAKGRGSDGGGRVCAIALDGIAPTAENVRDGKYPLCRPFLMVIRGELSAQRDIVRLWLRYAYSAEGQDIAEKVGLVKKAAGKGE